MAILPKKQKQELLVECIKKVFDHLSEVLIIVVLIIGTYLRLDSYLIGIAITAIAGNNISINLRVQKKTN